MALTKTTEVDQVEVVGPFKHVQIRTATIIKEDGTELNRSFHRKVLDPGSLDGSDNLVARDISGETTEVQGICNVVWTSTIKDLWKAELIKAKNPGS